MCLTSFYFILFFLYSKENWDSLKKLVRTKFYKSFEMNFNSIRWRGSKANWRRNGDSCVWPGTFRRFFSLPQVKLLRIYLTGPTSQICSEFFFLGERGAQSGLIGEFLVKMVFFHFFIII